MVYYVIDYIPVRFQNRLLNWIYHWVDVYCVKHADQTWNLSSEMANVRLRNGLSTKYLLKQITVPVGCHPLPRGKQNIDLSTREKRIVFLGILNIDQGIDLLIESMPEIVQHIPGVHLTVVGSGELTIEHS